MSSFQSKRWHDRLKGMKIRQMALAVSSFCFLPASNRWRFSSCCFCFHSTQIQSDQPSNNSFSIPPITLTPLNPARKTQKLPRLSTTSTPLTSTTFFITKQNLATFKTLFRNNYFLCPISLFVIRIPS
jgi:hypothetical protein